VPGTRTAPVQCTFDHEYEFNNDVMTKNDRTKKNLIAELAPVVRMQYCWRADEVEPTLDRLHCGQGGLVGCCLEEGELCEVVLPMQDKPEGTVLCDIRATLQVDVIHLEARKCIF